MKTHEVARTLVALAKVLRAGPDVELDELNSRASTKAKAEKSTIPMALSALVALSQFDKAQWRAVITEYGFPIDVKVTESTRDIVGKLLRHLEQDPESRKKLKSAVHKNRSEVSPELMDALSFLMR